MNILVTGSSGFVGRYLVPALQQQGHEVTGIDRVDPPSREAAPDDFVQGDSMEPSVLAEGLANVKAVVHLAAAKDDFTVSETGFYRENVEVTRALIEAGRERSVHDWLFYSSVGAVGASSEPVGEDAPMRPFNAYGKSKAAAEQLFRKLANEDDSQRVVIIRPTVIYGPENYPTTNVYRLINAIYRRRFAMVGRGKAVKTICYVENLVAATLFSLARLEPGVQLFHYVDEPVMMTGELVESIYRLLGRTPPRWHIPLALAKRVAYVADLIAEATGINLPITAARIEKFNRPSNFKAEAIREAGFEQPISNEEALRRSVSWHVDVDGVAPEQPRVAVEG